MAYKALYRTYRPTTFDEVAGQEHIVKTLRNAVEQNKIAHAYLFCGPRGTGKTSIAKIFAKAVNCTLSDHKPCMECENCLSITDGSHPDIVEIDAASNNGVEEVRSLIEKVKYAPIKGQYKVYIIDEVHMMSAGAFNALLKTIEEPPAHVIFILATTEPQKVLPTIISRCQRYDFTKVSSPDIINRIKLILDEEHIDCEDEVIRMVAQLSDGGMRDALSIMDQCIAYAQNEIKVHHINEIYGITTVKEKVDVLSLVYHKKAAEVIQILQTFIEKGVDIKRLTMDFVDILKESIIYDYTKDMELLHILNKEEVDSLLDGADVKQRIKMIDILMDTYDKYRNTANVNSYFEVCLLKMMQVEKESTTVVSNTVSTVPIKQNKIEDITKTKSEDVSRETFSMLEDTEEFHMETSKQEEPTIIETIPNKAAEPLEDEFVLQLLVGANKQEKQHDLECFQRISQYTMELEWAKEANGLRSCKIMASGPNYLILTVGTQAEANEINEKDSKNSFSSFMIELLGKNKKIYAVTPDQQALVTNNFRERMSAGKLPQAAKIEIDEQNANSKREKTSEERVIELFGKENIRITEE